MHATISKVAFGEAVAFNGIGPFEVGEPCDDKHGGFWGCVTHGVTFENQFQKDGHVMRGDHRLVWICLAHGPEVP